MSRHRNCLRTAAGIAFGTAKSLFDAGDAASALAFLRDLPLESMESKTFARAPMGASEAANRHPQELHGTSIHNRWSHKEYYVTC